MRSSRPRMAIAAGTVAAALVVTACQFSYSNPAERLGAGQVSGRTVADLAVGGAVQAAPGVSVSIKGSAYDQVTHDTGRFTVIPLPAGRHTLLFRKGTEFALTRDVEVALGPDGQPDGVSLGDVELPFAASVRGRLVGATSAAGGTLVDETTGLTAPAPGRYQLDVLSLGEHLLKFGMVGAAPGEEWVGGPVAVRLEPAAESSVLPLADVVVHPVTPSTGRVRFRLVSLHPQVAAAAMLVTMTEQLRGPVPPAGIPAPSPSGWVELDVPEGIYRVAIAAPPPYDAEVTGPPAAVAIAIAGQVADLGSLYLVPPGIPVAAQYLCQTGDDCGPGGVCNGSCGRNWNPPPAAPARLPLCPGSHDCVAGDACVDDAGLAGFCVATAGASYASCLGCGQGACTADGTSTTLPSPLCP